MVTKHGNPFLLVADTAWAMCTNASQSDVQLYLSTRAAQGFNEILFSLIGTPYLGNNNANYGTVDGIVPFSPAGPLPSPFDPSSSTNPIYWARMDMWIQMCAQYGLLAILDPYETGTGLTDMVNVGTTATTAFGNFIGARYANYPNILWFLGNDCDITNQARYNAVAALANGILGSDPNHLMTIQLYYNESTSLDNTQINGTGGYGVLSTMTCNGAYTYGPTYGMCIIAYNAPSVSFVTSDYPSGYPGTNKTPTPVPALMIEANYEFENNNPAQLDGGTTLNLRKQAFWSVLGGSSGQIYGNGYIYSFETNGGSNIYYRTGVGGKTGSWKNNMATPGTADLIRWANFFNSIAWYNLVPDQTHVVGTAGYGTPALTGKYASNNYVTVGASADGTLAVAYFALGSAQSLTVNMAKFVGAVTAQWFDPTNGTYSAVTGSPLANTGTHVFSPIGNNSAGEPDRVLLLTA